MVCGNGVPLCGVLTLETGEAPGVYHHASSAVHGLWPQVPPFGSSECLAPKNYTPPQKLHECYANTGESEGKELSFEHHEWESHGKCAGAADAGSFFDQVCELAEEPLKVMAKARAMNLSIEETADALQTEGYCVWGTGSHAQVELSACARRDGSWKLADWESFENVCGEDAAGLVVVV